MMMSIVKTWKRMKGRLFFVSELRVVAGVPICDVQLPPSVAIHHRELPNDNQRAASWTLSDYWRTSLL